MATKLEELIEQIDPSRNLDKISAEVDRAFNSFPMNRSSIETWQECTGEAYNQAELTVLACDDVPCDLNVFQGFLDVLRKLHDRDPGYRRELLKIRGLQLRLETRRGSLLAEQRIVDGVDEIALVDPPPDLFAIPKGYQRRAVLTELR